MAVDPQEWPEFEASPLGDIAAAFLKRRRAIRYHGRLTCQREVSFTPQGTLERLNVDYGPEPQLRLSVWDDGVIWLRACSPRPGGRGWAYLVEIPGELGTLSPEEVVRLFEESRLISAWPEETREGRFWELWRDVAPREDA